MHACMQVFVFFSYYEYFQKHIYKDWEKIHCHAWTGDGSVKLEVEKEVNFTMIELTQ